MEISQSYYCAICINRESLNERSSFLLLNKEKRRNLYFDKGIFQVYDMEIAHEVLIQQIYDDAKSGFLILTLMSLIIGQIPSKGLDTVI